MENHVVKWIDKSIPAAIRAMQNINWRDSRRKGDELTAASKLCENSLNSVSVSPSNMSEWEQLSRTLTIAWVAQALLMTWKHKTTIGLTKKKKTLLLLHMLAHWKWNDKILKLQQITILGTINPLPIHVKLNKVFKTGEQHAHTKNIAKDLCRMCRKE